MKKINFRFLLTLIGIVFFSAFANAQYFTEDFESDMSQWTLSNAPWVIGDGTGDAGPGAPHSGSKCAFIEESSDMSDTSGAMISIAINMSAATSPVLTYCYWIGDDSFGTDEIEVLASNDGTVFTSVSTVSGTSDGWQKVTVSLADYAGQSAVQIKIIGKNAFSMSDTYVDDIDISEGSSCLAPTNLTASNLTTTSATLNWTAGGSETAWIVEYGISGFTLGDGTIVNAAATSIDITGLTQGGKYDFYVKADCGSGNLSDNGGPGYFKTVGLGDACDIAIELNFPADFVSGVYNDIAQTTEGRINTTDTTCLGFADEGEDIFYKMTIASDMSLTVTLDPKGTGYTGILFSTDCPDSTNCVITQGDGSSGNAYSFDYDFTAGTYYIMIDKFNGADGIDFIADFDLKIENVVCPVPTSLTASDITDNAAKLSWVTGGATSWNVLLVTENTDTTGLSANAPVITTNPLTVDTLQAGTAYKYYVRDICDATTKSAWVGPFVFLTTGGCNPITTFPYEEGFENTYIPICWEKNIPADNVNDIIIDNNSHTGDHSILFSSAQTVSSNNYIQDLVSPTFTIDNTNKTLSFWTGKFDEYYMPDSLIFGISSTDTTWVGIYTGLAEAPGTWYKTQYDLTPFVGQDIFIIFRLASESSLYDINLDDVTINDDVINNVNNINNNLSVKVYPNPSNGQFTIDANFNEKQDIKLTIVDISGRVVYNNMFNGVANINKEIDVKQYTKGMYYIILSNDNIIHQEKIVIQ